MTLSKNSGQIHHGSATAGAAAERATVSFSAFVDPGNCGVDGVATVAG